MPDSDTLELILEIIAAYYQQWGQWPTVRELQGLLRQPSA
jgi:hypothetical protein